MEGRRRITEEDALLTELLIKKSYGNLLQAVERASARTISSASAAVKKHPVAAVGTAVGTGIILYGLYRLMNRTNTPVIRAVDRGEPARQGIAMDILSLAAPIVVPYVTAYLEEFLNRKFSRDRN